MLTGPVWVSSMAGSDVLHDLLPLTPPPVAEGAGLAGWVWGLVLLFFLLLLIAVWRGRLRWQAGWWWLRWRYGWVSSDAVRAWVIARLLSLDKPASTGEADGQRPCQLQLAQLLCADQDDGVLDSLLLQWLREGRCKAP